MIFSLNNSITLPVYLRYKYLYLPTLSNQFYYIPLILLTEYLSNSFSKYGVSGIDQYKILFTITVSALCKDFKINH